MLTHFLTRPLGNGCGCCDCWNVERTDAEGVTAPTQTPSAPTRSEEGHRVGASRRARLSRDGRTPTRRRPSRRVVRACGASFRKPTRRPGVAQAVADGVNYPRGFTRPLSSKSPRHWSTVCPADRVAQPPRLPFRSESDLSLPPCPASCLGVGLTCISLPRLPLVSGRVNPFSACPVLGLFTYN